MATSEVVDTAANGVLPVLAADMQELVKKNKECISGC
jgi:hypothetical protein